MVVVQMNHHDHHHLHESVDSFALFETYSFVDCCCWIGIDFVAVAVVVVDKVLVVVAVMDIDCWVAGNYNIERLHCSHCVALSDQRSLSVDLVLFDYDMDQLTVVCLVVAVDVAEVVEVVGVVVSVAVAANCYNCMGRHSLTGQRLVAADSQPGLEPSEIEDYRLVLAVIVVVAVVIAACSSVFDL